MPKANRLTLHRPSAEASALLTAFAWHTTVNCQAWLSCPAKPGPENHIISLILPVAGGIGSERPGKYIRQKSDWDCQGLAFPSVLSPRKLYFPTSFPRGLQIGPSASSSRRERELQPPGHPGGSCGRSSPGKACPAPWSAVDTGAEEDG